MAAKKRPRAERRAMERAATKLVEKKEKLAALEAGGSRDRPIEIATASLVEPTARGARCIRCDGTVRLEEHAVEAVDGRSLRVARVRCTQCGARRELWFAIALLH